MRDGRKVTLILAAGDIGERISSVLSAVPEWIDRVVVVDDGTAEVAGFVARRHGARVVHERQSGYEAACLAGASTVDDADVLVFAGVYDPIDALGAMVDGLSDAAVVYSRCPASGVSLGDAISALVFALRWREHVRRPGRLLAVRYAVFRELRLTDLGSGLTCQVIVRALQGGYDVAGVDVASPLRESTGRLWLRVLAKGIGESLGLVTGASRDRLVVLADRPCGEQQDEQSQVWQDEMVRHAINVSRQCSAVRAIDVAVVTGQSPGQCLVGGEQRVVFIGTGCPELSPNEIHEAFRTLKWRHVAIGPARDGGVYLFGLRLRSSTRDLLKQLSWNDTRAAETLIDTAETRKLRWMLLKKLTTIRHGADLLLWKALRQHIVL